MTEPRCPSLLQEEEQEGGEEGEGEAGEGEGPTGQREVVTSGDVTSGAGEGVAVPKVDRITTPYITKFERARVLGTRALRSA
jgi:DNA-directed RNA polymerase I, II, and III subunit RPABC2